MPLEALGEAVAQPVKITIPRPMRVGNKWQAQVLLVDSFGNLITNLTGDDLADERVIEVTCQGQVVRGLTETFGTSQPGQLIAMLDSSNSLSLCVVNGSAAQRLGAGAGAKVEVWVG
jgi:S-adenosylmethionine hydrolase